MAGFLIFLGIFQKCDKLVKFWTRLQITTIVFFWNFSPAFFLEKTVGLVALCVYFLLVFILAFIGITKASALRRLFFKAFKIISKHKNQELVEKFQKIPRNLLAIIILDFFLPGTWPFSFLAKLFFYKNLSRVKFLMDASAGIELD